MTLNELDNKLKNGLKNYLKKTGHIKTGKLSNSISFHSTYINKKLKISFTVLEYMQFLDDGDFIHDYLETRLVLNLISDFTIDKFIEDLKL